MENPKILLFDLDGTLLRNDKSLSEYTLEILSKYKGCGYLIGISTSRGEQNCSTCAVRFFKIKEILGAQI